MGGSDHPGGAVLAGFDSDVLDAHPSVVYALDPSLRLSYVNPQWSAFALENGADAGFLARWGVGASFVDAIAEPVRDYYANRLSDVLDGSDRWDHEYECSTPDAFRRFRMSVYPLERRAGLLVVNALVAERAHGTERTPLRFDRGNYVDANGLTHMCAHCRRVRHLVERDRWDWVPEALRASQDRTSHGLCPICAEYYWGR